MKTAEQYAEELHIPREAVVLLISDALEAAAQVLELGPYIGNMGIVSIDDAQTRIRALKPSPPVEHKKCPCCDAEAIEVGGGESVRIQCTRCYLQTPAHTTSRRAWLVWDRRVEGANG